MAECLYITSGTQENPAVVEGEGIDFDYIWGQLEHDCIVRNAQISWPPAQDMPKMFGCDRVRFEGCSIKHVRDGNGSHVEGIHLNGCRDIAFVDTDFDDNDIFHVFITMWGEDPNGNPFPEPRNITFERCRFGLIGPGGGYFSVKVRDDENGDYTNCPGITFTDCQRKGPTMDCPGVDLSDILLVDPSAEWPPFRTEGGTDPDPPDPDRPPINIPEPPGDLEARLARLEAVNAVQSASIVALARGLSNTDSRVEVIESDMTTLG